MKWQRLAASAALGLAPAAALGLAAPAAAQVADGGAAFVKAVREKDGAKAMELIKSRSATITNARDDKGETGLVVAIARRDETWTPFLLQNGADPNLATRNGDTPLMAAARSGYQEAAEWLLSVRARVDAANRSGETALILAVQNRHANIVKLLLSVGADPDKTDSVAGYSARDYAKRDNRTPEVLRAIEAAKPKKAAL